MLAPDGTVDVAVIGFGPVGAALAGLLGLRGVNVLVLERDDDVFPLPRAAHVDHTGLRIWQELGLLDQLLPNMQVNGGLDFVTRKNELLARIPSEGRSPSGLPFSVYFFQPELDRAVRDRVSSLPSVSLSLGTNVTQVVTQDNGVLIRGTRGGRNVEVTARWVVACDGASSSIRDSMHVGVEDLHFEEPWLVVDVVLNGKNENDTRSAVCRCDPARPTYSVPMPLGRHRFEFRLMPGDDPASIVNTKEIKALITPWFPEREFEVERSAIYTFHGLVADQWRHGRILLAGDAAHQMPPFLGQGMCSGLRDAANLAWKLDMVVKGLAAETLLDTYQEERRRHVRSVVDAAVSIGRVICTVDPVEAAQRDYRMLADYRPPWQRITFTLPPLMPGPLILDHGGDLFIQPWTDGKRLDDVVGRRFAVFARHRESIDAESLRWWVDDVGAFVATVDSLSPQSGSVLLSWLDSNNSDVVVVRPDRYVLWAGTDSRFVTSEAAKVLSRGQRVPPMIEMPVRRDDLVLGSLIRNTGNS